MNSTPLPEGEIGNSKYHFPLWFLKQTGKETTVLALFLIVVLIGALLTTKPHVEQPIVVVISPLVVTVSLSRSAIPYDISVGDTLRGTLWAYDATGNRTPLIGIVGSVGLDSIRVRVETPK